MLIDLYSIAQNNLRNPQFVIHNTWKQESIAYRLATRATKEIAEIEIARSKKRSVADPIKLFFC